LLIDSIGLVIISYLLNWFTWFSCKLFTYIAHYITQSTNFSI